MSWTNLILIALALAMDCFAVSLSAGAGSQKIKVSWVLKIAGFFGGFQGGMLFLGWLAGSGFQSLIQNFDHWLALILLVLIGGRMLFEARKKKDEKKINFSSNKIIILLAVATSIDALAVGISLAFLAIPLIWSVVIVAIMSFLLTIIGATTGKKIGSFLGNKAEIIGGLILIFIGLKIFIEHSNFLGK